MELIRINRKDNAAVALRRISAGECVKCDNIELYAARDIPCGHKMALRKIAAGENIVKYGFPIGFAARDIERGDWLHTHNIRTNLDKTGSYEYVPENVTFSSIPAGTFSGFLREDGRAATRNELWIIPTVGCVNGVIKRLAEENQSLVRGNVEGLYAFPHQFGCSQTGEDHAQTRKLLAALCRHPNAAGVLVVGLGCENLTREQFTAELGEYDERRIKLLICQETSDEFETGKALLQELAAYADSFKRVPVPVSKLVVGLKCGGSDGLSGITANPVVGKFSDMLISEGGSTILTEVPEMFGAEQLLLNRCINREVFDKAADMLLKFKEYYLSNGQKIYENPSPGNKDGGISTLEDKSLGCVQKGGTAPVVDVIGYGESIKISGLNLLAGPGNDLVSTTALTAAGSQLILFTTGRGTPFGAPVPTLKISSGSDLALKKPKWIDFNAGLAINGMSADCLAKELFEKALACASGERAQNERCGFRDISIWKKGVVL